MPEPPPPWRYPSGGGWRSRRRRRRHTQTQTHTHILLLLLMLLGICSEASAFSTPSSPPLEEEEDLVSTITTTAPTTDNNSRRRAGTSTTSTSTTARRRRPPNHRDLAAAAAPPPPAGDAADTTPTPITYTPEALTDEITTPLPGLPPSALPLPFRQFSGYLPITPQKNIFYWYVEATDRPDLAPLTLWLNGGPGCSGFIGLMNENGPFRPTSGGEALVLNPYSWNIVANMLYIEQPVSVGFSFATGDLGDKAFGDDQAAQDNYLMIQVFLQRFPHLRERELHLSGESYGGRYIPSLARYILDKNQEKAPPPSPTDTPTQTQTHINLKGFLVGNPSTDPVQQLLGQVETLWSRHLLPPQLYQRWNDECAKNPTVEHLGAQQCVRLQQQILQAIKDIDVYAINSPPCPLELPPLMSSTTATTSSSSNSTTNISIDRNRKNDPPLPNKSVSVNMSKSKSNSRLGLLLLGSDKALVPQRDSWTAAASSSSSTTTFTHTNTHPHTRHLLRSSSSSPLTRHLAAPPHNTHTHTHTPPPLPYDPCQAVHAAAYLNREDVQRAIHVFGDTDTHTHTHTNSSTAAGAEIETDSHTHTYIWEDCSAFVLEEYEKKDWEREMEPTFKQLASEEGEQKLRILIYSGDEDTVCSTRGTERWLDSLGWSTEEEWHPWYVETDEQKTTRTRTQTRTDKTPPLGAAGKKKKYVNGVVFMTVAGAGHEVPSFRPREALWLFEEYLGGRL